MRTKNYSIMAITNFINGSYNFETVLGATRTLDPFTIINVLQ